MAILGLAVLLLSCAGRRPPEPVWSTEDDAIEIVFQADPRLNQTEGMATPLKLVVYQLQDANTFYKYADDEIGLIRLLRTENSGLDPISPSEYVDVKECYVQPGQVDTLLMPRLKGTQWVAVVAGYRNLVPDRVDRLFKIPVAVRTRFPLRRSSEVQRLAVRLKLGARQIEEVSGNYGNR